MTTINLAPSTEYLVQARKRRRRLFLISGIIILLAAAMWTVLFIYQQQLDQEKEGIEAQMSSVQTEIARLGTQAERVQSFENRLVSLQQLLDAHLSWDVLFAELEKLLPSPTVLTSLKVSLEQNNVGIIGITPDIDQVALTIKSLEHQPQRPTMFTQAELTGITRETEETPEGQTAAVSYSFSLNMGLDSAALKSKKP